MYLDCRKNQYIYESRPVAAIPLTHPSVSVDGFIISRTVQQSRCKYQVLTHGYLFLNSDDLKMNAGTKIA